MTYVPNPATVNVAQFTFTGNVIIENTGITANPLFISNYTRQGENLSYATLFNASNAIPSYQISGFTSLTSTPLNFNNFNRILDWKDDLSKIAGNHELKTGILVMRSRKNQNNIPAINGTFAFNTSASDTSGNPVADALLGNYYTYTEASGVTQGWYRFSQVEPYVQDNWKINNRLTVNIGFRYAYMQPQYSALGNTTAFLPQYYNAAQAVTVLKNGTIVPNSGAVLDGLAVQGTGFSQAFASRYPNIVSNSATASLFHGLPQGTAYTDPNTWEPRFGFVYDLTGRQSTVLRGGYGVFYERIEGNYLFSAINNPPFVQQPTLYNGNVENPAGGTNQVFPSTINNSHYLDMKDPRTMNWSLGVEQKLSADSLLSVSYVGSSAANLAYQDDINQLKPGTLQAYPGYSANALRPYLGFADIYEYNTGGNWIYNSLQFQYRKHFTQGGLLNIAYTWASARTDANAYNYQPMNSYNLRGDWGPSNYTRRQVLVASYVYPLPFWLNGKTWYQQVLGGWQLSGVTTIQSGLPFNVTVQNDPAGIGISGSERPFIVGPVYYSTNKLQYLNPAAFAVPAPGTFGNMGAYALFYPWFINWDASLQKAFPIGERVKVSFRAELYNFPNHLSYTSASTTVGSANFGQITGATDPRTLQLALRLSF